MESILLSIGVLSMTDSLVQLTDQGHHGDNENTAHQIADAVGNVGGEEAEFLPDQGLLKGKARKGHLVGDQQKSEGESVVTADQGVGDGSQPLGHIPRQ